MITATSIRTNSMIYAVSRQGLLDKKYQFSFSLLLILKARYPDGKWVACQITRAYFVDQANANADFRRRF